MPSTTPSSDISLQLTLQKSVACERLGTRLSRTTYQRPAKLIQTGKFSASHHYCRLVEVHVASVLLKEGHAQDSILLEVTYYKGFVDRKIPNPSR